MEWLNSLSLQSDINTIGLIFYSEYGFILIMLGFLLFIATVVSVDVASKNASSLIKVIEK